MEQNKLPWERPKPAMIISIFSGRVTSITNIGKVEKVTGDGKEIPR